MTPPTPFRFPTPAIGLGTWQMGEHARHADAEVRAIVYALEQGVRLIDTAEMYADGRAETLVGRALKQFGHAQRDALTLVTKVLPANASRTGTIAACEASLRRLGVDHVDVYLLHWQGRFRLEETLEAFARLRERGLIRHWGVSNFDHDSLQQWLATETSMGLTPGCATNQVYYSLLARGPEFDLLPAMDRASMPLMAYTPLGSGTLARDARLAALATPLGLSAAQLALAWTVRDGSSVAIPKSSTPARIAENLKAASVTLDAATVRAIDQLFPPPTRKTPLAVI